MINKVKQSKWAPLLLSFLLGMLIAAGLFRYRTYLCKPAENQKHFTRMLNKFSSRLDLTPDQKQAVSNLLQTKREKIKLMRDEMKPRFDEIRKNTSEEIRKLLNPNQLEKFKKFEEEQEKRWERRRNKWSGENH
jgi:Spy/CpxP family protein refolding chaperone